MTRKGRRKGICMYLFRFASYLPAQCRLVMDGQIDGIISEVFLALNESTQRNSCVFHFKKSYPLYLKHLDQESQKN
jgi:hypothetical protein